jgi:UrcA family protein
MSAGTPAGTLHAILSLSETMMSVVKRCVVAIVTCSVAALSGATMAADWSGDVPTVTVSYADLNLDRPEGAAVLYRRIKVAGKDVCSFLESRNPHMVLLWEQCMHKAIADAVAKVDKPVLTAYYRAKNPQAPVPATVTAKN